MTAVVSGFIEERVQQLAIAHVQASPKNPRGEPGDVAELAESIKAVGILEPLIVSPTNNIISTGVGSGERWVVVAGHRRLAAAKAAGLKTVPALVRQLGEREQLVAMLVENLQRVDLSPLAEARGYQQLAELEYSQREIARQVGKSQSHVAKRLALLKLSPKSAADFESGGISGEDAVTLAGEPAEIQERVLAEKYPYGSMASRIKQVKWALEEAKKPKPKPPSPAQRAAEQLKYKAAADRQKAKQRAEEKLRNEAKTARLKVMPKVLSRGERELQHAAAMIAQGLNVDECGIACELLGLKVAKSKQAYGSQSFRVVLARRAAASKVKAVEVLLALALGLGETHVRSQWSGPSAISAAHLGLLRKAGYKPNSIDRKLARGGRR